MLSEDQIMQEFKDAEAMLSGHFILSSGMHSSTYLQCARVLMDAKRGGRLCAELARKVKEELKNSGQSVDIIMAPAMGGVVVGYEMGRQMELPSVFCERVDSSFALRRGFHLEPGQKVLIVEDVVTTGKSSVETIECIKQYGGEAVAVASLIDRRGEKDNYLQLPLVSLIHLDIPVYKSDDLPPELDEIPPVKPGSRWLKG